jgi:sugar-specific transcriptional regulator TrmB
MRRIFKKWLVPYVLAQYSKKEQESRKQSSRIAILSLNNENIGIFTQLGLTIRQAEVYLTIFKLKQAKVKTIADTMQIARAEIYRAIPPLERIGLIERVITTPIKFRAVPINEGLAILLQLDVEKHNKIQTEANALIEKIKERKLKEPVREEPQYVLIHESTYDSHDFIKKMTNLRMSLDGIIDWTIFKYHILNHTEIYKKALERGVKIRDLTYMPEGERIPEVVQTFKKSSLYEIRFTSKFPPASLAILDKKETIIITPQTGHVHERTILWSNDIRLAATYRDYFELKWSKAKAPD